MYLSHRLLPIMRRRDLGGGIGLTDCTADRLLCVSCNLGKLTSGSFSGAFLRVTSETNQPSAKLYAHRKMGVEPSGRNRLEKVA